MIDFGNFIDRMDLVDVTSFGGKFTCYKLDEIPMSRIDKILLLEVLLSFWKFECQCVWVVGTFCT